MDTNITSSSGGDAYDINKAIQKVMKPEDKHILKVITINIDGQKEERLQAVEKGFVTNIISKISSAYSDANIERVIAANKNLQPATMAWAENKFPGFKYRIALQEFRGHIRYFLNELDLQTKYKDWNEGKSSRVAGQLERYREKVIIKFMNSDVEETKNLTYTQAAELFDDYTVEYLKQKNLNIKPSNYLEFTKPLKAFEESIESYLTKYTKSTNDFIAKRDINFNNTNRMDDLVNSVLEPVGQAKYWKTDEQYENQISERLLKGEDKRALIKKKPIEWTVIQKRYEAIQEIINEFKGGDHPITEFEAAQLFDYNVVNAFKKEHKLSSLSHYLDLIERDEDQKIFSLKIPDTQKGKEEFIQHCANSFLNRDQIKSDTNWRTYRKSGISAIMRENNCDEILAAKRFDSEVVNQLKMRNQNKPYKCYEYLSEAVLPKPITTHATEIISEFSTDEKDINNEIFRFAKDWKSRIKDVHFKAMLVNLIDRCNKKNDELNDYSIRLVNSIITDYNNTHSKSLEPRIYLIRDFAYLSFPLEKVDHPTLEKPPENLGDAEQDPTPQARVPEIEQLDDILSVPDALMTDSTIPQKRPEPSETVDEFLKILGELNLGGAPAPKKAEMETETEADKLFKELIEMNIAAAPQAKADDIAALDDIIKEFDDFVKSEPETTRKFDRSQQELEVATANIAGEALGWPQDSNMAQLDKLEQELRDLAKTTDAAELGEEPLRPRTLEPLILKKDKKRELFVAHEKELELPEFAPAAEIEDLNPAAEIEDLNPAAEVDDLHIAILYSALELEPATEIIKSDDEDSVSNAELVSTRKAKDKDSVLQPGVANPEKRDSRGRTPIFAAAVDGDIEAVRQLMQNTDIEARDSFGDTVLLAALSYDHTEVAQLLIENGANIHVKTQNGLTTLMLAAIHGNIEMIRLLISKNVKINETTLFRTYETALYFAKKYLSIETKRIQHFKEKQSDNTIQRLYEKRLREVERLKEVVNYLTENQAVGEYTSVDSDDEEYSDDDSDSEDTNDNSVAGPAPAPQTTAPEDIRQQLDVMNTLPNEPEVKTIGQAPSLSNQIDISEHHPIAMQSEAKGPLTISVNPTIPDSKNPEEEALSSNSASESRDTSKETVSDDGLVSTRKANVVKPPPIPPRAQGPVSEPLTKAGVISRGLTPEIPPRLSTTGRAGKNKESLNKPTAATIAAQSTLTTTTDLEKAKSLAGAKGPPTIDASESGDSSKETVYVAAENGNIAEVQRLINSGEIDNKDDVSVSVATTESTDEEPVSDAGFVSNGEEFEEDLDVDDPEKGDEEGLTPLLAAAEEGNLATVSELIAHGNINERDKHGNTPLMIALTKNHTEVARLLIERGADINGQSTAGVTALIFASINGNMEIIRLLIDKHVEINVKDYEGKTALTYARLVLNLVTQNEMRDKVEQRQEVVNFLLASGATEDFSDDDSKAGPPPAALTKKDDSRKRAVEITNRDELLEQKSKLEHVQGDKKIKDKPGISDELKETRLKLKPVDLVNKEVELPEEASPNYVIIKKSKELSLVNKSNEEEHIEDDSEWQDYEGVPIYETEEQLARKKSKDIAPKVKDAEVKAPAQHENVPDITQPSESHEPKDLKKTLMGRRARIVEEEDLNGDEQDSKLEVHIGESHYIPREVVIPGKLPPERLTLQIPQPKLAKEIAPEVKAPEDKAPEDSSLTAKQKNIDVGGPPIEIKAEIEEQNPESARTALINAIEQRNVGDFKIYINSNNIDIQDNQGRTALAMAAEMENIEVLTWLIENKANTEVADNKDRTPLLAAAEKGNIDIVTILIKEGKAFTNTYDDKGRTPLLAAAEAGHTEVVRYLLAADASVIENEDIGIEDRAKRTPLIAAAAEGKLEVVKLLVECLLENSRSIDAQDDKGRTALTLAVLAGKTDVVKYLIENKADTNIVDSEDKTMLQLAQSQKENNPGKISQEILDLLKVNQPPKMDE